MTLFHLALGLSFLLSTDAAWSAPTYEFVFRVIPREGWGVAHLVAGCGAAAGFFLRHVPVIRLNIAFGAVLCIIRALYSLHVLTEGSSSGLNAIPIWLLIAVFHLAAVAEPASNPANSR